MNNSDINCSIRSLCEKRKYYETSKAMKNVLGKLSIDLERVFSKKFERELENTNKSKLSFSFKVSNDTILLKRRLQNMNKITTMTSNRKVKKLIKNSADKSEVTFEEKIPEEFLKLMDELCLDRKNARKFFENPSEWAFVKSDRKIFCPHQGILI